MAHLSASPAILCTTYRPHTYLCGSQQELPWNEEPPGAVLQATPSTHEQAPVKGSTRFTQHNGCRVKQATGTALACKWIWRDRAPETCPSQVFRESRIHAARTQAHSTCYDARTARSNATATAHCRKQTKRFTQITGLSSCFLSISTRPVFAGSPTAIGTLKANSTSE